MLKQIRSYRAEWNTLNLYKRLFKELQIKSVFDVGANSGRKTKIFLKLSDKVLSVEPNAIFVENLKKIGFKYPEHFIETSAVSVTGEPIVFYIGNHNEISTTSLEFMERHGETGELKWDGGTLVNSITIENLCLKYFHPDFLKIDCEGTDAFIIQSLKQKIRLIEFEYLDGFSEEIQASIVHLMSLGKYSFNFSPYEGGRLLYSEWLPGDDFMIELKNNIKSFKHGNIFAKEQSNHV